MAKKKNPTLKDTVKKQQDMRRELEDLFSLTLAYMQAGIRGEIEGLKVNAAFINNVLDFLKMNNLNIETVNSVGLTQEERMERQLQQMEDTLPDFDSLNIPDFQ